MHKQYVEDIYIHTEPSLGSDSSWVMDRRESHQGDEGAGGEPDTDVGEGTQRGGG